MKNTRTMASCLVFLLSGAALAATSGWSTGVVREVNNDYARVSVNQGHGDPGLQGHGPVTQYCTIEVGKQLVTGEREVRPRFDRSSFAMNEDRAVSLKITGDTMKVKDNQGNERSFHVIKTMPDTPANMPDRTAFSERPIIIQ
jgi:pantothenate kinase-related protein Tda10